METMVVKILEFLKGQSIQVAIVFIAVLMLTWLLRNKSAHIRYLLWLLVAVKCLTPPVVIFPVPVLPAETVSVVISAQNPDIADQSAQTAGEQIPNTAITVAPIQTEPQSRISIESRSIGSQSKIKNPFIDFFHLNSTGVLLFLWAAGAALYLLQALSKAIRLQMRLKQIRQPLPPELMIEQIEKLSQLWNHPDGFDVWLLDGINQPFVWGLWRGAIYLPTRFQNIEGDKQKAIILHEMAHVVRYDAFVNLIQILIQGVFWFHPLVWLANKAIRQEREKCCDEIAVARLGKSPKEYGSAIVDTLLQEAQSSVVIPTLAVAGPVKNIEDRIKTIMQPGKRFFRRPSMIGLLVIAVLAIIIIPTTIALTHKVTPPDYTLSGTVFDAATDKPIAGAIVFDDGYGPQPYQKGITDQDGKFEYKSWNEEHNVTAKADGYQQQTMIFTTFPLDNSKNLNFKLQPGSLTVETSSMKISFSKNLSLRDALQILGKAYKKNIIPSDKITGVVPVTDLYDITSVEQALQAILGTNKYVVDGNFIRVYTEDEFKALAASQPASSASKLEFRVVPEVGKDLSESDLKKYQEILETQGPDGNCNGYKWIAADTSNNATWHKTLPNHLYQDTAYVLLCDQPDKRMLADGRWGLVKVSVDAADQKNATILAEFDDAGASLFGELTKRNLGKGIAIIVDGKALSAPHVQSVITKQAAITGNFTNEEIANLVQALIKGMPPMGASKESQKPLSSLSIPQGASPRVTNALKTISDLMISLDAAEQKGQTLSAEVFNQINEQCDNLQGKNNIEMPDVAEWGKLPSRLIDILELLHKMEETAEGCRSLTQGNYPDILKQQWQTLKEYYNQLSMFLTPRSNNL